MPLDPRKARLAGAKLDAEITRKVGAFEKNLAVVYAQLRKRIVVLTRQMQRENGRVVSTGVNLGIARAAARELEATLEEAGFSRLIAESLDEMGDLAKYQGAGLTRVARVERHSAWSAETLDVFRDVKLRELVEVKGKALRAIEQTLLKGIVGAQDEAELLNELLEQLEVSLAQARTIYDTALSEFSQVAVASTATGEPDEAFLYEGPIDGLMRPFCFERVGRVYTRDEIDAMDNGQLDNTLITRGGYNCRHVWLPVPPGDPLEAFADTGELSHEVYAGDLAEAEQARVRLKAAKRKARTGSAA